MARGGAASDLLAECVQESRPMKGTRCGVSHALNLLGDELQKALDSKATSASIARALKRRGIDCGPYVISRHRRAECRCGE